MGVGSLDTAVEQSIEDAGAQDPQTHRARRSFGSRTRSDTSPSSFSSQFETSAAIEARNRRTMRVAAATLNVSPRR